MSLISDQVEFRPKALNMTKMVIYNIICNKYVAVLNIYMPNNTTDTFKKAETIEDVQRIYRNVLIIRHYYFKPDQVKQMYESI